MNWDDKLDDQKNMFLANSKWNKLNFFFLYYFILIKIFFLKATVNSNGNNYENTIAASIDLENADLNANLNGNRIDI